MGLAAGDGSDVTGIVLAAGAGLRAGGPKALRRMPDGTPWLASAVAALGPCRRIIVVLGAGAEDARPLVPAHAEVVVAPDWKAGMSASLGAGLAAASGVAALVTLVDLPGLTPTVARRLLEGGISRESLRRAVFGGRPGHPVLIGADHWPALVNNSGPEGARQYLAAHGTAEIECGDLSDGLDVDGPA